MAPRSRLIWPFSISAWKRDTSLLSQAECTAYMNLLMYYWEHGGLPDEDAALRRIAGTGKTAWGAQRRKLKKFFRDGWKHGRMDADLEAAARYSQRQSAAAQRRWHPVNNWDNSKKSDVLFGPMVGQKSKQNQRPADALGMPPECSYKIDRLPFISSSPDAVDKAGQSSKASASFPKNKPSKQPAKGYAKAQHGVLTILARGLGLTYAEAMDILAEHPDVCERATDAELRAPGTGVQVAVVGLQKILRGRKP